jgi:hypothetical protein
MSASAPLAARYARLLGLEAPEPPEPPRLVAVDPADGVSGVLRDGAVLLRFSRPLDPRSVTPAAIRLMDGSGALTTFLSLSPDRRLVVCAPHRTLAPESVHFVVAAGLLDGDGREVPSHLSRFVTGGVAIGDLAGS